MPIEAVLLLLVAAVAVAACRDRRVRSAAWWRLLAAAVGAALTPALPAALFLWLADPAAATEPFVWAGLAASAVTGLLVGAAALGLRSMSLRLGHRRRSA